MLRSASRPRAESIFRHTLLPSLTVGPCVRCTQSMAVQDLLMSELAAQEEKLTPRAPVGSGGRDHGAGGAARAVSGSRDTQLDSVS